MSYFPPPPLATPPGLWRRTPPAIFSPILGLLAVGTGWRILADIAAFPEVAALAEALLGAAVALYAFALVAYLAKPLRRPGVVAEDLRILPGRSGLAAAVLCMMLSAGVMAPYAPGVALGMLYLALGTLALLGLTIARMWLTGPAEARVVTPIFHLNFVGYIVAAAPLAALGAGAVAQGILWATMPVAVAIWAISLRDFLSHVPPAPLRPLLAIHAAPASLFSLTAATLGFEGLAMALAALALAYGAVLVGSARWLLGAGFSALWGSLTFPSAAISMAVLLAYGHTQAGLVAGAVLLFLASTLTAFVLTRVLQAWARGKLAQSTNAAVA